MKVKDLFESLNENDRRKVVTMMRKLNESASEVQCPKWLEDFIRDYYKEDYQEDDDFYYFDDPAWCVETLEFIDKQGAIEEAFSNSLEKTSLNNYTTDFFRSNIFEMCVFKTDGVKIQVTLSREEKGTIFNLLVGTKSLQDYTDRIAKFYADKIFNTISM